MKADRDYFGDFSNRLFGSRITLEDLRASPEQFLYFGKISSSPLIDQFKSTAAPVNVIYSQWLGYLDGHHTGYAGRDQIAALRQDPAINFIYAHTSGHATVRDLKRLAEALNPRALIPVHTEHGEDFSKFFANVRAVEDGMILNL